MANDDPKKLCFIVGPIGAEDSEPRRHADWLLDGIIKPVMDDFPGFNVKRADHDSRPGLINSQMINDLLNAELVIADLSFSNPNAFYEIGIRHVAQKPIIHMQLATEKPPFDVSLYRAIKFSYVRYSDLGKAREELRRFVEAVLSPDYQVENPVTNARGHLRLEQNATPPEKVLLDQLQAMRTEIDSIKSHLPKPQVRLTAAGFGEFFRQTSSKGEATTYTLTPVDYDPFKDVDPKEN